MSLFAKRKGLISFSEFLVITIMQCFGITTHALETESTTSTPRHMVEPTCSQHHMRANRTNNFVVLNAHVSILYRRYQNISLPEVYI